MKLKTNDYRRAPPPCLQPKTKDNRQIAISFSCRRGVPSRTPHTNMSKWLLALEIQLKDEDSLAGVSGTCSLDASDNGLGGW